MGENSGGSEHTALVNGKLLSGDALLEHARNKGLCHKCLETVTHRRIRKKFGISRGWEPITVTDDVAGNYTVYKGYCLQPTCWTLEEAQIVLGEKKAKKSTSSRRTQNRRASRRPRASVSVPMTSSNSLSTEASSSTLRRAHNVGDDDSYSERRSPTRSRSRDEKTGLYQLPYIDETRLIEDSARRFGNTLGGPSFASRSSGASTTSEFSTRSEDPTRKSKALELGTLLDAQQVRSNSGSASYSFRSHDGVDEGRMRKKRASVAVPMRKKPTEFHSMGGMGGMGGNRRRISMIDGGFETKKPPSPLLSSSVHSRHNDRRHSGSFPSKDAGTTSTLTILEMIHKNGLDSGSLRHGPKPLPSPRDRLSFDSSTESLQYQNLRSSNHGEGRKLAYSSADELPNVSNHSSESTHSVASSSQDNRGNLSDSMASKNGLLEALSRVHAAEPFDQEEARGLWTNLNEIYKRSPGLNPKLTPFKTILYILEQERHPGETYTLGWKLLAQVMVSPQEALTDYNIAQNLFRAMVIAFDQEIEDGGSDNLQSATQTLFALFEIHGAVAASVVSSMITVLDRSKRLQWSAALLDSLLSADTESDFFAQALLVINKLLSLRANGIDSGFISPEEEMMMLTMLVGFVVSVLSGYEQDSVDRYEILKSKSAISLLSYISSRAGVSAISDRHYECIEVVCETIGRHLENKELVEEGSKALLALETLLSNGDMSDESPGSRETKNVVVLLEKLLCEESGIVDSNPLVRQLLGILKHSTEDEEQARILTSSKIPKQLIKMLGDDTLAVGASALLLVVSTQDLASLMVDPEMLPALESALAREQVLPEAKANICKIISNFVSHGDSWVDLESFRIESLLDILNSEEGSADLLQAAQCTLSNIITVLPEEKFSQHRSRFMEVAIAIAQADEGTDRVAIGFDLMGSVLLRSQSDGNFITEETISVIVTSMEFHFCSIEVVTACCRVLRKIIHLGDNGTVIAGAGVSRLIINAMMIYPTSKEFLLEAMAILDIFASKENFRATFDDAEAEAAITSLLAASQYKPDVLAMAFGTLNSIVRGSPVPSKAPPIQAVVLNCIVMALKTYPGNEGVSSPSLKLLQTYSYNEDSLSLMREQSASLVPILSNSNGLSQETCENARFIMCRLYNQYNGFAARVSRGSSSRSA